MRVDPARSEELVATTDARIAEMRGRLMPGWLRVDADRLEDDPALGFWVRTGTNFARSLPVKSQ